MDIGYLFISNDRVVPKEQELSLDDINIGSFEKSCIDAANVLGFELYMGINRYYANQIKCTDYDISFYNQHIYRNIFGLKDIIIGYKNLSSFLKTHENIQVIHCNTPIGGVLGRICGYKYHRTVIYTAHGFHFYKGAPLINRTLFYWIEKWMARYTNVLITINKEDFNVAKSFRLQEGGKCYYVPGVGVDINAFDDIKVNIETKRLEFGLRLDDKVGIVVGDLNSNKNVGLIIKATALCSVHLHLLICGVGPKEKYLRKLAQSLNVSDRIHFLGYRTDVRELYKISDIFIFASKREGLPRTTMEAMCAGLPCIVSKIRGNVDLIDEGKGGFLVEPCDTRGFANAIDLLLSDVEMQNRFIQYNKSKICGFSTDVVIKEMTDIYRDLLS